MKNTIMQELIDWTGHNCVPEHRACDMPKNSVFCADCMVAFVKADRLRHLPSQSSGQQTPVVATCSKCGLEHRSHMSAANCCR